MVQKKATPAFKPTKPEQRVLDGVARGVPIDFMPDDPQPDDETNPDNNPAHGETWGEDRTIRAEFLNRLLLQNPDGWTLHPHGIRLLGARITGVVNLAFAQIPSPLLFVDCRFDAVPSLDDATLPVLMFRGCHLPGLSAQRTTIKGNVFLDQGFTATGAVEFMSATIGGELTCEGGTFNNPEGDALTAQGAAIKGGVFLKGGFTATGAVGFNGATIGSQLICENGTFNNPEGNAINAQGASIEGGVFLTDGSTATGTVNFNGAAIGGQLSCEDSTLNNPEDFALTAQGAIIKGGVFLRGCFIATGMVDFMGATISGQLTCKDGTFNNPEGDAINAQGASIEGDVFLTDGFTATGTVDFNGSTISGQLFCKDGTFNNPEGDAINAQGASIEGDVFLTGGFTATGAVKFNGATIVGQLDCNNGTFANEKGFAFDMESATVQSTFVWKPSKPPVGLIDLSHAHVKVLDDNLARWPMDGRLILDGFVYGELSPVAEHKAGLRLAWIRGQFNPNDTFTPRPYEQLIKVLRAMGHDRDAREVAVGKQEDLRNSNTLSWRAWSWNWLLGKLVGHGYRPWRALGWAGGFILLGTVLFGWADSQQVMRPSKERITMSDNYRIGLNQDHAIIWWPPDYPEFNAFVYSADVFLPIVDLHQEAYWLPTRVDGNAVWSRRYEIFLWFFIAAGWVITTIGVVGLTGIVKKD